MELMVEEHEKAINLFKDAEDSDDPDLWDFAVKTLPVLKKHLEEAKALEDRLD